MCPNALLGLRQRVSICPVCPCFMTNSCCEGQPPLGLQSLRPRHRARPGHSPVLRHIQTAPFLSPRLNNALFSGCS